MAGLVYIDSDTWKYENAGTADLLSVSGTTLTELDSTKSKTGTAFYQTASAKCFDLPTTKEIWIKFDVFFDGSNRWRAYNGGINGITGITAQTDLGLSYFSNGTNVSPNGTNIAGICKKTTLQTFWLHMISGSSDGVIEAWVDGTKIYTYTGDVNHGQDFSDIYLQSDGSGTFFSNVTISNVKPTFENMQYVIAPEIYATIKLTKGEIDIKPEVYASIRLTKGEIDLKPEVYASIRLTKGEIDLKPQIYATIIIAPKFESVRVDTCRVIQKSDSATGDTLRQVGRFDNAKGDTQRIVQRSEQTLGDTRRIVTATQSATGDTLRKIGRLNTSRGDTLKNIVRTEQAVGDTKKIIGVTQTAIADTLRVIFIPAGAYFKPFIWASVKFAEYQTSIRADTLRRLGISDSARADTLRQIGRLNTSRGDTLKISSVEHHAVADTLREIVRAEKISADTLRRLGISESITGDTLKQLGRLDTARADTLINLAVKQKVIADTLITRIKTESVKADTLREVVRHETARADTLLRFVERVRADTLRIISKTARAIGDTVIRVPHIWKYVVENAPVNLKGTKNLLRSEPEPVSIVNSLKDYNITHLSISLNEATLSDNFQAEMASDVDINDAVNIQLLDYEYTFLVEEINQRDLINSIKGMYDVDRLLYTQLFANGTVAYYKDATTTIEGLEISQGYITKAEDGGIVYAYAKASDYVRRFAKYLGLTPNMRITDFTPYNVGDNTNMTYRDLISAIFGWTSRLAPCQINVFIRGGKLHCIQRGMEESTFDISELPHSRPQVSKKLIRSLWNRGTYNDDNSKNNPNAPDDDPLDDYTEEEVAVPFSGTLGFTEGNIAVSLKYSKGLLTRETNTVKNSSVNSSSLTTYGYIEIFDEGTTQLEIFIHKLVGDFYLKNKSSTSTAYQYDSDGDKKVITQTNTEYVYSGTGGDNVYLSEEWEETYREEYEFDSGTWVLSDSGTTIRQTLHTPVGNGWYAQSVYVDGEPQGSNLSQGKPGNKVTPYTINEAQKTFSGNRTTIKYDNPDNSGGGGGSSSGNDYEDWRRRLSPIMETSFPVMETAILRELTNVIEWLNWKIQEEVSVDLISKFDNGIPSINHIVDFTERIILDGNEYFLISNQINFTPRKFIQRLKFVRWYSR